MQVSQVAYDRFVLELPAADATWRPLADAECLAEAAAWLWDFGPTPLVAVVGHDGAAPNWLTGWTTRQVGWAPAGANAGAAVAPATRSDPERFLLPGARRPPATPSDPPTPRGRHARHRSHRPRRRWPRPCRARACRAVGRSRHSRSTKRPSPCRSHGYPKRRSWSPAGRCTFSPVRRR